MTERFTEGFVRFFLVAATATAAAAAQEVSRQAYELLKKNCFACHGGPKMSGLDLRTRESVAAGGERGKTVVPFDLDESRLYQFASHEQKPTMPPGQKLSEGEIGILKRWIEAGAPLEAFEEAAPSVADDQQKAGNARLEERAITPEERRFWAFQPPRRTNPPRVSQPGWTGNPVDAFLASAMQAKGLKPSQIADRRTLIRRAYLDLLGLPPAPEAVEAFLADPSPDAWDRLVDRLLASPHYGERWARHWLDLVRYADSGGFEFDVDRPNAWRYRDYVVRSFNADKPYNQFLREQLAGDEYAPDSPDAMIATGLLRLEPEGGSNELGRQESLDDIISTSTAAFLGLTVGCARCHHHKFDPIPQKDYYRIQAVFFSTRPVSHPMVSPEVVSAHRAQMQRIEGLQKPLKKEQADLEEPYRSRLVEEHVSKLPQYMQAAWRAPAEKRTEGQRLNVRQIERALNNDLSAKLAERHIVAAMSAEDKRQHQELRRQIAELEKQKPKPYETARAIGEAGRQALPSHFLHRGSPDAKGSLMTPGVLSVLQTDYQFPAAPEGAKSSWRRRGFAEWVVSPANPLTARVMVNRLWQHHFGEGIVRTPSNFGQLGERPSHPELLDWLAVEFVERGWSLKQMHRLMMISQSYQMASQDIAGNVALDSENRFFWRMPRQRVEAEIIRDLMLATAGTLDGALGGPGVFPYINPDLFQSSTRRTWPGKPDDDPSTWRRSLYVFSKRSIRYPLFETFDQPNLINSCDRRNRSTIAPQALLLMNNAFVILQAKHFAQRLEGEAGGDPAAQVERAYRVALGRLPSPSERAKAAQYIRTSPNGLAEFCQALFNLNEFVYRP